MTEREMLIEAYKGINTIPLTDFAKMVNVSFNCAKKRAEINGILIVVDGRYYVTRNLSNKSSVSSQTL